MALHLNILPNQFFFLGIGVGAGFAGVTGNGGGLDNSSYAVTIAGDLELILLKTFGFNFIAAI